MTAWNRLEQSVLTNNQVRQVDRVAVEKFGMHSLVLMENAALNCTHWLQHRFSRPQKTVILCGRGNNGGDGLAMARHLQCMGWPCQVIVLGPRADMSADARENLDVLLVGDHDSVKVVSPRDTAEIPHDTELVIDAMLGTGASGDPRPPFRQWIELANASPALRVALDIPTGVDAETGQVGRPAFRADATLTFLAQKPAMANPEVGNIFGEIAVLPIGIPAALVQAIVDDPEGFWKAT